MLGENGKKYKTNASEALGDESDGWYLNITGWYDSNSIESS